MNDAAEHRIGKYRIVRPVDEGGTAVVYEAFDPDLQRRVALKVLRVGDGGGALVQRLHREAAAAAKLRHPGIVAVHDVGTAGDPGGPPLHFIAMDFIEGPTLARAMGAMTLDERLRALLAVAEAVAYAHGQGIIHRDLKPHNVLIESATRRVFLADFGLAKVEAADALTRTGTILGTPHYMSPEQVMGRRGDIGTWTDVWALGAMLYEMTTGTVPFPEETAAAVYERIVHEEPEPPRRRRAGVPADLETICLKALEKETRRRYRDAAAFAADVRRFLADEPIAARRTGVAGRFWRRVRRHPSASAAAAAALLVVAAAAAVGADRWSRWKHAERELDARMEEHQRRRRAEDALRPASSVLDRWELGGREPGEDDERQARAALDACAALAPGLASWHLEEGRFAWMKQRLEDAEDRFGRAAADPAVAFLAHYYRARVRLARYSKGRDLPPILLGQGGASVRYDALAPEADAERELREAALGDLDRFRALLSPGADDHRADFGRALAMRLRAARPEEYADAAEALERAAAGGQVGPWEAHFEAAIAWFFAGKLEESARASRKAIEGGRSDALVWNTLGLAVSARAHAARTEEGIPEAVDALSRAVALRPDLQVAWLNRGHCRSHVAALRRLRGEDPTEALEEAAKDYERCVQLQPERATGWAALAIVSFRTADYAASQRREALPDYERAAGHYARAIELDGGQAHFWSGRGITRAMIAQELRAKRQDPAPVAAEAERDFERAIELAPGSGEPRFGRGMLRIVTRNWSGALEDFRKAAELSPSLAPVCDKYIRQCERALGRPERP